jgi:F-type H+-transporting ATPase subunit gamma
VENSFILIGKKGEIFYNYKGAKVIAEFPKADIITSTEEIIPVAKLVIEDYLASKYDKVFLAYTDFINPAKQVPRVKQLLPVDIESEDKYLGVVGKSAQVGVTKEFIEYKEEKHLHSGKYVHEYTFEPNPQEVLDMIIPRLIEIQLYQALLESTASEHSARMTAMHQATESANDMVNELTLFYNKARQAGITAEIAEISAGANALAEV